MKKLMIALSLALVAILCLSPVALANDEESSTMYFEGELEAGVGGYEGLIPMVDEASEGIGDGIAGYDVYAMEGATVWFGDLVGGSEVWTSEIISNHDPFPTWDTDTPDWYQYSLMLDNNIWAVSNHSGATEANPWSEGGGSGDVRQGVPMSGIIDWDLLYALEIDVGEYQPPLPPDHGEIPGGAESRGGGAQAWDMDWSWGSEMIPLQYPGFAITVIDLGKGSYQVIFTPAPEPVSEPAPAPTPQGFGNIWEGFAGQFAVSIGGTGGAADITGVPWVEGWQHGKTLAEDLFEIGIWCNRAENGAYLPTTYMVFIPAGTVVEPYYGIGRVITIEIVLSGGEFCFSPNLKLSQPAIIYELVDGEWVEVLTFTQVLNGKAS